MRNNENIIIRDERLEVAVNKMFFCICSFLSTIAVLYIPGSIETESIIAVAGSDNAISRFIAEIRILTNFWGSETFLLLIGIICIRILVKKYIVSKKVETRSGINLRRGAQVSAIIFTCFMVVGKAVATTGSVRIIFSSAGHLFMTIVSIIGYYVIFSEIIAVLILKMYSLAKESNLIETGRLRENIVFFIFDSHPYTSALVLMILCELPYWITFYPGTAMADALLQLTMYYGPNMLSNHHPIFSTLLMGIINDIGRWIGDNNFGLFLYTFFQSILQFAIFAFTFVMAKKYKISYCIRMVILLFFCLFPALQIYAITAVKDTMFSISFFAFTLFIIVYWLDKSSKNSFWLFLIFLSAIAVWMFRNNGYYIVLIGFIVLLAKKVELKYWCKISSMILAIIIINSTFHNAFMPWLNAAEGSPREMLSIFTQQTARYCKEWGNEITEAERAVLEDVFTCTPQELGEKYMPELSNNTKESFVIDPTSHQIKKYFEVWFKQFLKHPITYIDAAVCQNYGYWYPDREVYDVISYYTIESSPLSSEEYANLQFEQNEMFKNVRTTIQNIHQTIEKLPGIGYLYSCGFYTWIVLFLCAVLLASKHYKECLVFFPTLASIAVNCVSPVNAYFRYQLPIIVVVPLLLLYTLVIIRKSPVAKE